MTHPPNSRQGYARKQARPAFDFLQDTRPCIKVYTESDLPQKRPNPEPDQNSPPRKGLDKFCQYVDKLETLFNSSLVSSQTTNLNDSSQPEEILEVPVLSTAEVLKNFVIDLDKACKLTGSQLKVLEKYGVEWNSDPWKFEPRIHRLGNQGRYSERGGFGDRRRDGRRFRHRNSLMRVVRKFDELNTEEIFNELAFTLRTWNITKGFSLKKLVCEVSIKKDIIAQSKIFS